MINLHQILPCVWVNGRECEILCCIMLVHCQYQYSISLLGLLIKGLQDLEVDLSFLKIIYGFKYNMAHFEVMLNAKKNNQHHSPKHDPCSLPATQISDLHCTVAALLGLATKKHLTRFRTISWFGLKSSASLTSIINLPTTPK